VGIATVTFTYLGSRYVTCQPRFRTVIGRIFSQVEAHFLSARQQSSFTTRNDIPVPGYVSRPFIGGFGREELPPSQCFRSPSTPKIYQPRVYVGTRTFKRQSKAYFVRSEFWHIRCVIASIAPGPDSRRRFWRDSLHMRAWDQHIAVPAAVPWRLRLILPSELILCD